jgi:uncharacterized MnhB-related membrane protein
MTKTAKFTNAEKTSILWNEGNSEMIVPDDMGNRHRREIQEWVVDEGGVIEDWVAPTPEPRTTGTFREFMELFTEAEQTAIIGLTQTNVAIKLWYDQALAGDVWLGHAKVEAGLSALVTATVITEARKDEIIGSDYDAT